MSTEEDKAIGPRPPARERGPSALKGLQLSATSQQDLIEALTGAKTMLRLLDVLKSSSARRNEALDRLRTLSAMEVATLRRETLEKLAGLRAELRRRGRA